MRRVLIFFFSLAVSPLLCQPKNVKLFEGDASARKLESAITINNRDPKNIAVAISPDKIFYSMDQGVTWGSKTLHSPYGMAGDPSLISDVKGDLQMLHLSDPGNKGPGGSSWLDRIVCQTSGDGGATWTNGTWFGTEPFKPGKWAWSAAHPKKQIIYSIWTQFDKYGSDGKDCQSNIMFTMSTNPTAKWDKPISISQAPGNCMDDGGTVIAAMPAVGLEGRIYAAWCNQEIIYFDRSYDTGKTWLRNDLVIGKQVGGWMQKVPGFEGIASRPVMLIDNGPNRTHGSLYMAFADQRNGSNDTDIWFVRSTSRGDYWTNPIRVNQDDPGKHQFSPWMTIDQVTGAIFIIYLDRRNYDDNQTDVYAAWSTDGGNTFREKKISESPFIPEEDKMYSRLCDVSAHDGILALVWTRFDKDKPSVWTMIVREDELIKK